MSEKLLLIDGHSILNRAYYGLPDLTNAKGLHTGAVYGFLSILFKIMEEEQPDYLAVAFDVHAPTFRHEMYDAYKGTRKSMDEELRQQVPVMKQVLQAMGVLTVEQAGLEADDILGTLAKKAEKQGLEVSLVSGDRDLLQIASEHIKIRIPKTKMGRTEIHDYYAKDVQEAYGLSPEQFIHLKALMGDTADNIPGVPKVGEKTASELMKTYGSLEEIYAHVEEISKKSIRESLIANKDLADLSLVLATIKIDCELPVQLEQAKLGNLYTQEAYKLFQELEFKNLLKRFEDSPKTEAVSYHLVADKKEAEGVLKAALKDEKVGILVCWDKKAKKEEALGQMVLPFLQQEKEGSDIFGIALARTNQEPVYLSADMVTGEFLEEMLKKLSESNVMQITFGVKDYYQALGLTKMPEDNRYYDVLIAAYINNPLKSDYQIEDVAREYMGAMLPAYSELFGKASRLEASKTDPEKYAGYMAGRAHVLLQVQEKVDDALISSGQKKLFTEMEMPLSFVLYAMEKEGVLVKREQLKTYGETLSVRIAELEAQIWQGAGEEFNINSPKQLGEILFGKMGLQGGKKTKTGYSTAADVLEKLAPEYPIVGQILEYRGLTKLKSTYADGLADYIGTDERIHTSFNQTITATGRISSTEPNLQNIPMRTELGRQIRKVFIPKKGAVLMDADYSQIELRILASMSGDEQLIDAYRQDADIHRITAAKVFHVEPSQVTDLQRRNAKAVNFGIVYGISSFGLSQDLSITRKEAASYIDTYFETYPGIKQFLDASVENAKEKGYSVTLFGRRRPIPELSSSNFMQRGFGERVAMNAPIQGTAADIIKIAMISVYRELSKRNLKSKLILQVHDELLIETVEDEIEEVREILASQMKGAATLPVELEIDLHTGENWYDAH